MKARSITLISAIILSLAAGAAGAYAYYSAQTKTVTNTYNIVAGGGGNGDEIGQVEEVFDPETAKDLEPRSSFKKEAKVNSNVDYSSYVYMCVSIPNINARISGETSKTWQDSVVPDFDSSAWTLVKSAKGDAKTASKYLYRYGSIVPAKGSTSTLFSKVTVPDYVESDGISGSIDVTGYMISSVNVSSTDADKDAIAKFFG